MNIHCSACGTSLPTGSLFCPGCGLPLTAHAVATPTPRKKAFPLITCLLGLLVLLIMFLAAADQGKRSKLLEELHAGGFTPESFQSQCGRADQVEQQSSGPVLRYRSTLVQLHIGAPVTYATLHNFTRNGHAASIQIPLGEDSALGFLRCGTQ